MGGNSSHLEEPSNSSSESYQKTKERLEQLKEAERWQRLLEEERQRKEAELRKLLEEERQLKEAHRQQRLLEQERQRKEAEALRKLLEEERQWKKVDRQQRLLEEEHQRKEAERMRRLLEEQRQRIEEERQQRLLDEERYRIETERMRRILEEERQRMEAERQERLLKEELREKEEQHQKRLQERREKLLEEQRRRKFLQDGRRQEIYNEQILQKEKCQQTYIKKEQQKSSEEHQERSLDEESLKMFLKEEYQEKIPEREQKHYMMGIMNLYTFAEGHMELSKAQGEHDTPVKPGFLHSAVLRDSLTANWDAMPPNKTYVRVPVREDTEEFRTVKNSFKSTTQKRFIVNKIERVQNPFLLGCYLLKKSEMQNMYGVRNVKENVLFRGAFEKFIDKNCEKNFNWRIFAVSKHNKLGEGLTLSPISYIANFCAEREATNKTMFLLRVLVSKVTEASENMEIPPLLNDKNFSNVLRFDTTGRRDGKMIVKFTDNEFYPNYIIHYTVGPELQKKGDKSENLNAP
ncbi:hypothetical protein L9F63_022800 [Diploptera punctata]|uniref:Poly [ADP-ribose] polymerase n=1 Tax=Diploptera punctata TaxID=6984 RepID=A0AAD7ZM24_DIPPU|nr:hypothetical protein L9F63_022800 [Diploptera punctata]